MLHTALAAGAGVVALAFSLSTFDRWVARREPHQLAWTVAFALFLAAAACLWWGAADRWSAVTFRLFYLFGAITNVPVLALGTVYLLGDRRRGDRALLGVLAFCAFAAGVIAVAPLTHAVPAHRLPQGSDVFGALPRVMAAAGSGVGALVVVAGAVWSVRRDRRRLPSNALIAGGTLVLGAGGVLNSALGAMNAFSLSLLAGIALLFAGYLVATAAPAAAASRPFPAGASPRS